jgi:hypothetical protein
MDPANAALPPVFLPPGTPVPPPIPVLPINENGIVTADVPCRGCSYNVRGLSQDGKCPECGTPVGLSIRGNLLCYSDPAWVEKLLKGIDLILWGLLASVVASGLGVGIVFAMGPRGTPFFQGITILASAVGVIGAWLLTSPDPGTEEQSQVVTARKIVRFALLFGVAESILTMWSEREHAHPFVGALIGVALILAAMVTVVGEVARLYYLKKLAMRIPDTALAKRANMLCWGYGISLAVVGIFSGAMVLVSMVMKQNMDALAGIMMGAGCVISLAGITLLGFMIVYIIMLFQFRRALKFQANYARQTWAMAIAPASLAPPPVEAPKQMGEWS